MEFAVSSGNRRSLGSRVVVAAVFAALALPSAAAGDWPVYGHDLANSRDGGSAGPPPSALPTLSQAWKFNSPTGDFTGTPVIARGALVAGDNGGFVYALDAASGRLRWSRRVGQPVDGSAAIDVHAPGGPAVFVPVAASGAPRLVALSLAHGTVRWKATLTRQANADVFGSPVFWHGRVYIGTSGPNNDNSHARGSVVAVNERSGKIAWRTFTVPPHRDGAAVWTTPAIDTATGRLYVGTGNNYHAPTTDTEDSILALDAASGRLVGRYQATANDAFSAPGNPAGPDVDFGSSPNLIRGPGGRKLVGAGQKSGIYWALDRSTMKPVWHRQAGPGSEVGGFLGSTAYDGARIYGANTVSGQVVALRPDGSIAWQSADPGGLHWSPTTVANGVVYTMGPEGMLTARDAASGSVLTELPLGGPSFGGVAAVGRALYVSVGTGPPPAPAPQNDGHGAIVAFGETSRSPGSGDPASTFSGSCQLSGTVSFKPPLTVRPQPIDQDATATGTCTGTFVDRGGHSHALNAAPVSYRGTEHGDDASCGGGTDSGSGQLTFPYGTIGFAISEVRATGGVVATITGNAGGSARALAEPSPSQSPASIAQACAGTGLREAAIDIQVRTTPDLSG
jgi:polyvinyl alcohol dehydrogenase (cytochrome)